MKWIGQRISFVSDKEKTTIVISPDKNFWVNAGMGAWLAMWLTVGIIFIFYLFEPTVTRDEKTLLFVISVLWGYYFFIVSKQFFWLLWGKEMLKLTPRGLVYKKDIKGYGKSTLYYFDNMGEIEINAPKSGSFQETWEKTPWTKGGGTIQFEYYRKFIRFGMKLNAKDVKLLFQLISSKRAEYEKIARREEKQQNKETIEQ